MQKRLFAVLALLLTSLLLVSCKEKAAENKVDPKVLAATVEKAMKAADALDNMNSKAYEMGQVGFAMVQHGAAGSAQVLDEAAAELLHGLGLEHCLVFAVNGAGANLHALHGASPWPGGGARPAPACRWYVASASSPCGSAACHMR